MEFMYLKLFPLSFIFFPQLSQIPYLLFYHIYHEEDIDLQYQIGLPGYYFDLDGKNFLFW